MSLDAHTTLACKRARVAAYANLSLPSHHRPPPHTVRTFALAIASTRLFYAAGGWAHNISSAGIDKLQKENRRIARIITGIPANAAADAPLLDAHVEPASVTVGVATATLVEKWRRLPPGDHRRACIDARLPQRPAFSSYPYHEHPFASTFDLVDRVLQTRHVPASHTRINLTLPPPHSPPIFAALAHLHFIPVPPGEAAVHDLLVQHPKDTEEGRTLRHALNDETLAAAYTWLGTPTPHEIWSDASVEHPETARSTSSGYAALWYPGAPPSHPPTITWQGSAGRLACSYTAERLTARSGIRLFTQHLLHSAPADRRLLIALDNQGLVQHISGWFPSITCEHDADLCNDLLALASTGWRIAVIFCYSHVGTPRNEHVDTGAATALQQCTPADHDSAPIDLNDFQRAVRVHLTAEWKRDLDSTFRVRAFGPAPLDLRALAPLPQSLRAAVLRARVDCSPDYGKLHRLLHPRVPLACRLCGLHAMGPQPQRLALPETTEDAEQPRADQQPDQQPAQQRPANRFKCRLCPLDYASREGLIRHMRHDHNAAPADAPDTTFACECGKHFKSFASRRVHRQTCTAFQHLLGPQQRAAAAASTQDIATIESFEHFWTGACALPAGPTSPSISDIVDFLRDLKARLDATTPTRPTTQPQQQQEQQQHEQRQQQQQQKQNNRPRHQPPACDNRVVHDPRPRARANAPGPRHA